MPTHTHSQSYRERGNRHSFAERQFRNGIDWSFPFQVSVFADSLIPTVRRALCDPLPQVRQVAANTFDHLHTNIGQRALDEILPYLLQQLVRHPLSLFALPVCLLDTFL